MGNVDTIFSNGIQRNVSSIQKWYFPKSMKLLIGKLYPMLRAAKIWRINFIEKGGGGGRYTKVSIVLVCLGFGHKTFTLF